MKESNHLNPVKLVDENHSLRRKNHVAYAAVIGLTALSALFGHDAMKTRSALDKARQESKDMASHAAYFQKDAAELSLQNIELKEYASDAQMLAESMKFYPDMPDFVESLPEVEQEKAEQLLEEENKKGYAEHDKALKTLGVDENLLLRLQKGPKIYE